jgi:hypothetical protein
MKTQPLAALALLLTGSYWSLAQGQTWTPADLPTLTQDFVAGMSAKFKVSQYPWTFLTAAACLESGQSNCVGANPASPYGYPQFGPTTNQVQLKTTDAIVLLMATPPPMAYYGITTYMIDHYYPSYPTHPGTPGTLEVLESLNDTVNMMVVSTAGSPTPGQAPFSQLSVFVITADSVTNALIQDEFQSLGYPSTAINNITLPYSLVPLSMGVGPGADTYSVFARIAYPDDPDAMATYIAAPPINVIVLDPLKPRAIKPLPSPTYRVPGDPAAEAANLKQAQGALIAQLVKQYSANYSIAENTTIPSTLTQTDNFHCIWTADPCALDNSDAIYLQDALNYTPSSQNDQLLIVGVNHAATGKATYISDSVVNYANDAGVVAASSLDLLNGSALTMAGITSTSDPRYPTYSQLYAYTISYNCAGQLVCMQIPVPTETNPLGIPFGSPFKVTSRTYLDPATATRPASDQLIFERAFYMKAK